MRALVVGCGLGIVAACADPTPAQSGADAETSAATTVETSGATSATASATSAGSATPSAIASASEPEPLPSEFMQMAPASQAPDYLKQLAGPFRRCFQKALANDATIQGSVKLHVSLDAKGVVQRVTPKNREGLPDAMVECCVLAVKAHTFDPPPPDTPTLTIPLSFKKAQ